MGCKYLGVIASYLGGEGEVLGVRRGQESESRLKIGTDV